MNQATRLIRHPNGSVTRVPAHMCAPERERAPVTMADWMSRKAPEGYAAKVWK